MSLQSHADDRRERLREQLRAALGPAPTEGDLAADALTTLLADLAAGRVAADEAEARLASAPDLRALLRDLAGRELRVDGALIAFGAGSQLGDVSIGDVAGRDIVKLSVAVQQTLIAPEQAYDVRGLPNPYIGLRAFTYDDRASFAGRGPLVRQTVQLVTAPGDQRTLLFVTGASGSGKSSFAQAGLLPALEAFYLQRGLAVRRAVMRPGPRPLAALADALLQLGWPPGGPFAAARPFMLGGPGDSPDEGAVGLLVIDQFEELFSPQADFAQRDALFAILSGLPSFAELRMHLIATLRADYLPDLFAHRSLYEETKQGVDLRAMHEEELREAILRPLQRAHPDKRFEPSLLDRLAADAAAEAAYLPLLQVSLEDLFRGGSLTPGRYHSLTDSLRARADAVQDFLDYDGERRQARPEEDRAAIMAICLDLVRVSLDDDSRRDVRRRQPLTALLRGTPAERERRRRLVGELIHARLLSASVRQPAGAAPAEEAVEVDIIHESLIARWDRLRSAVADRRDALRQGEQFSQALAEWRARAGQPDADDYLLSGVRLAVAEALAARDDVVVQLEDGRELIARSRRRRDEARRRQLRRTQGVVVALAALSLVAVIAAWFAVDRQRAADANAADISRQLNHSEALRLASLAGSREYGDAMTGMLLAAEAVAREPVLETINALHERLDQDILNTKIFRSLQGAWDIQISRDGRHALISSSDLKLLDIARGEVIWEFPAHSGHVYGAAYSPDGSLIATAPEDAEPRILAAASGEELRRLVGHTDDVSSVQFSPDGRRLLTASYDGTARIWDVATGASLHTLAAPSGNVLFGAWYSPDGRLVATAGNDQVVWLWDAESGRGLRALGGHAGPVREASFAPDRPLLATGASDGTVRLWDVSEGTLVQTLRGHTGEVMSVSFHPAGTYLLTSSYDGSAVLWELEPPEAVPRTIFAGHSGAVTGAHFTPDGQGVLTRSNDGTLRIWRIPDGTLVETLGGHIGGLTAAAMTPASQWIVTGGSDGTLRLWERFSSPFLRIEAVSPYPSPVLSPDGRRVAITSWGAAGDGGVALFDMETGRALDRLGGLARLGAFAFTPDGRALLFYGSDELGIARWEPGGGQGLQPFRGPPAPRAYGLQFSPDGARVLALTNDPPELWDTFSGRHIATLQGTICCGTSGDHLTTSFSADGRRLAIVGHDHTIHLWDAHSGREVGRLPVTRRDGPAGQEALSLGGLTQVIFSPDGAQLALTGAGWSGSTLLVDAATGKVMHRVEGVAKAFSPSGRELATIDGSTVFIWDTAAGEQRAELKGHTGSIWRLQFTSGGDMLATFGGDRTVRLWRTGDWQSVTVFRDVVEAQMALDGSRLAISGNQSVELRLLRPEDLLAATACRAGRSLSPEEQQAAGLADVRFVAEQYHCPPRYSWQR